MIDRREELAEELEREADWRLEKSREYPDDRGRNERSSKALMTAAADVRVMSLDSAPLAYLIRFWNSADDDAMGSYVEEAGAIIKGHGFHNDATTEDLLRSLAALAAAARARWHGRRDESDG